MTIYPIGTKNDDETRNIINNNFGIIDKDTKQLKSDVANHKSNLNSLNNDVSDVQKVIEDRGEEIISSEVVQNWLDKNEFKPKDAVATFNDLPQDAELKELRGVIDENAVYVYDGEKWVKQSELNFDGLDDVKESVNAIYVNINDFGARTTNSAADNDIAINRAILSLSQGQRLLVPYGDYQVNNIIFDPPNDCGITMLGRFIGNSDDVCVTVGNNLTTKRRYSGNIRVSKAVRDWSKSSTGIQMINLNECDIAVPEVSSFTTNIKTTAHNNKGYVHNTLRLGLLWNGKTQLHVEVPEDGWNNESVYYMGRYAWGSDIADKTGCVGVIEETGSTNVTNNNRFLFPSFEGGTAITPMKISGRYTYILSPRLEGVGNVVFEKDSLYCYLESGRGVQLSQITDLGTNNRYTGRDGRVFKSSNTDTNTATYDIMNSSSTANVLVMRDGTGNMNHTFETLGNYTAKGKVKALSFEYGTGGRTLSYGATSPESSLTAPPGSLYVNGATGTLWIKQTGIENIGWSVLHTPRGGSTNIRPTDVSRFYNYFDTSLGKPIWLKSTNPNVWVDSTGTVV